jgi:hypothetical protein
LGQVVALAALESRFSLCHAREGAEAVPLDLEQPSWSLRHLLLAQGCQHRAVLASGLRLLARLFALLQQQPVLLVAVEVCRDERPGALESPAV